MEAVLERDLASPADLSQTAVKYPFTRLLDLLAGWERYADQDDMPDTPSIVENIADLYQEAGNLEVRRQNDAQVEATLRAFLKDRVLPVLMQK